MNATRRSGCRVCAILCPLVTWLWCWAAAAADPPVVTNAADPARGRIELRLVEEWRAGGEDDEIFFGSVGRVASDDAGLVYILDTQLSQVHVYSPAGEYLRSLAREGDGPGEVRRPNDMILRPDGEVWLLQGFPGKIVKVDATGQPAGSAQYDAGGGQGQFGVLVAGRAHGTDAIVLAGIRMVFSGGANLQTLFLDICGLDGTRKRSLLEKEYAVNFAELHMDELSMDFVWNRFAVGRDGTIYTAPPRNDYRIEVRDADGTVQRVITRPYASLPRRDEQRERAHQLMAAIGANYPSPPQRITTEETEPDIGALYARPDGVLWVATSRGAAEAERTPGTFTVLDEFDRAGIFQRQIAVAAPGDPEKDQLWLLGDDRAVLVVGALDAFLSQQGVVSGEGEAGEEEASPLEVIGYRFE